MQFAVGDVVEGKVVGVKAFGAFVEIGPGTTGMVHISEIASSYVKDINEFISLGDTVKVKVLSVGADNKISLSIKSASPAPAGPPSTAAHFQRKSEPDSFEDMMNRFKHESEEKIGELKKSINQRRSGGYTRRGGKKS